MAKTYPVACECGTVHPCEATQAGTTRPCQCGRTVQVPSLVRLKTLANEPVLSADFELQHALQTNSLPEENDCYSCFSITQEKQLIGVECERAEVKTNRTPNALAFIFFIIFGLIGVIIARLSKPDHDGIVVHGRNVAFQLPVRVCPNCRSGLNSKHQLKKALTRTPLYGRLLEKYPHAKIELVKD